VIEEYFDSFTVKNIYKKEFISIFDGWLGEENLYKIDEVTENEWSRFNCLLKLLFNSYDLYIVNRRENIYNKVTNINSLIMSFEEDMEKSSDDFFKIIIPELDIVLTEEWDYVYILWYKDSKSLKKLEKFIKKSNLFHFNDLNNTLNEKNPQQFENKNTGEIWEQSYSNGGEWKVGIGENNFPTKKKKIIVNEEGKVLKKDNK
jgi:hypothetical protein